MVQILWFRSSPPHRSEIGSEKNNNGATTPGDIRHSVFLVRNSHSFFRTVFFFLQILAQFFLVYCANSHSKKHYGIKKVEVSSVHKSPRTLCRDMFRARLVGRGVLAGAGGSRAA